MCINCTINQLLFKLHCIAFISCNIVIFKENVRFCLVFNLKVDFQLLSLLMQQNLNRRELTAQYFCTNVLRGGAHLDCFRRASSFRISSSVYNNKCFVCVGFAIVCYKSYVIIIGVQLSVVRLPYNVLVFIILAAVKFGELRINLIQNIFYFFNGNIFFYKVLICIK